MNHVRGKPYIHRGHRFGHFASVLFGRCCAIISVGVLSLSGVNCASVASAERVGKAAESLNVYKDVVLSLGENCGLAKAIQVPAVGATSAKVICEPIEADEKSWGRGLKMFVDYGSAMTKLAAKPKLDGEDATSNLLSVAEKLEWASLDGDTSEALSKAAGILVQWLAREIRRKELVAQAVKIDPDIQSGTAKFLTNLERHLETLCTADTALAGIRSAPCLNEPCPVLQEAGRQATLEHLRVELRFHRIAAVDLSISLAGFAAAHATLVAGGVDVGRAGDRALAKKIDAAAEAKGKEIKTKNAKYIECQG